MQKRKIPRHGGGSGGQMQAWSEHWKRALGTHFKRKSPPRTYERPNPPFFNWWRFGEV